MAPNTPSLSAIAVDEHQVAAAIGMSLAWVRKDRRTARTIPFFKLGTAVRYDLERVREALRAREEGGAARR